MSNDRAHIYTALKTIFDAIHYTCYAKKAPEGAAYPYAVYHVGQSRETDINSFNDIEYPLELNIWDDNPDTTAFEAAITLFDGALTNKHVSDSNVSIYIIRNFFTDVTGIDEFINRERMLFNLKVRYKE
jgi:hypothetical protein